MKTFKPLRRLATVLLAAWCASPPLLTDACSPVIGYVRPTNYELVKQADAIVLATASAFEKKGDTQRKRSFGTFSLKVLERIKGDLREEFILSEGDNDIRTWGEPYDFSFTKADHGPCNPTDYQLGSNYVLFLRSFKGKWYVGGAPFSRVNVLVEGTNAPWTRAVREYARIAALDGYEKEKTALRDLRSRDLAGADGYTKALARDIDAHFRWPTPAKSFSDLRAIYDQSSDDQTRERVLWACALGEKRDAIEFFAALLKNGTWLNHIGPICRYVAKVKLTGFHERFAAALATQQNEHERRMLLVALAGSAEYSEQALMQKVLESVPKGEIEILANWFETHPSPIAIDFVTKLASKAYAEEFQLTQMLAGMGDTNVLTWAREFVKNPGEQSWLGYYVFAVSPLPEADALARQVVQRGDSDGLVWLVQGYPYSKGSHRLDRLKEAMALKTKSQKLNYWIRRTLDDWADDGDKEAERLLRELPVIDEEPP